MPPADTPENRLVRLAQSPLLRAQTFAVVAYGEARFPLRVFAWGDASLPAVCVLAGVHGDEPSGIEAALRLLERLAGGAVPLTRFHLLVFPCLNPSGFADGTRANRIGQDINRQFHADRTQESAAVRAFLDPRQAAVLADLHGDPLAHGYYLFELRQEGVGSLAAPILDALTAQGHPLEEAPFYAGYVGHRGLFAPTTAGLQEFHRRAAGLSLAEWGWMSSTPRTYSLEAPTSAAQEPGATMHLTALLALFAALEAATEG